MEIEGQFQNEISDLSELSEFKYENIFKLYQFGKYYTYNLIGKVSFDDDVDADFWYEYEVKKNIPWTILSYEVYGTIDLWWLICSFNNIQNPIQFPERGLIVKIIRPDYVRDVMDRIFNEIDT